MAPRFRHQPLPRKAPHWQQGLKCVWWVRASSPSRTVELQWFSSDWIRPARLWKQLWWLLRENWTWRTMQTGETNHDRHLLDRSLSPPIVPYECLLSLFPPVEQTQWSLQGRFSTTSATCSMTWPTSWTPCWTEEFSETPEKKPQQPPLTSGSETQKEKKGESRGTVMETFLWVYPPHSELHDGQVKVICQPEYQHLSSTVLLHPGPLLTRVTDTSCLLYRWICFQSTQHKCL